MGGLFLHTKIIASYCTIETDSLSIVFDGAVENFSSAFLFLKGTPTDMEAFSGLVFLGVLAFLILWAESVLKNRTMFFVSAALVLIAMLLRAMCMPHETADYQNFLAHWVDFFRTHGGWRALNTGIGNYNVPYLYFLALFSYSEIPDLYLIKWLSVFFDVMLAWAVMRLCSLYCRKYETVLASFFVTLFLPTVVLNGAYWGQCDSIYAAFALWSVYFALSDRPIASVCFIALSFAFKLQAVFLMPVFLIFLFARKVKWWHLAFFPVTYLIVVLPAVLLGRPFKDTILLYFNQTGSVGSGLNYNSSSVFAFVRGDVNAELLSKLGILFAFLILILIFIYSYLRRRSLDRRALLTVSLLIAVAVPYFLPHMHDRYFFIADVLSVAFAFACPHLSFVPVAVSFASLLGYHAYLKMRYLLPMRYGAAALLVVILTLIICYAFDTLRSVKKRS